MKWKWLCERTNEQTGEMRFCFLIVSSLIWIHANPACGKTSSFFFCFFISIEKHVKKYYWFRPKNLNFKLIFQRNFVWWTISFFFYSPPIIIIISDWNLIFFLLFDFFFTFWFFFSIVHFYWYDVWDIGFCSFECKLLNQTH